MIERLSGLAYQPLNAPIIQSIKHPICWSIIAQLSRIEIRHTPFQAIYH